MEYKRTSTESHAKKVTPRLIIHGGAGNITPDNLPKAQYDAYHAALLTIVSNTHHYLMKGNDALDTVTYAVEQLENNPLFNSGKGAVFTRDGHNEMEASVMVSRGKKKRGVGVMGLQHVKNPIKLAREMLIRGEKDLEGGNGEHRGPMASLKSEPSAQGHDQLYGEGAEKLAKAWGLEMVEPEYFFDQKRWDEHVRGLEREKEGKGVASWDVREFVPQGTCGAVALDADGVCAVATSTGGMTNKLSGRIGDTPTLGAGFWAEEWEDKYLTHGEDTPKCSKPVLILSDALKGLLGDCLPSLSTYSPLPVHELDGGFPGSGTRTFRSTAISGTGNGDSFLRMNAVRTASAIARYRGGKSIRGQTSLREALAEMTGPDGELVKSAGDRWKKTGEGEGGMIGIECIVRTDADGETTSSVSHVIADYNCGGMFRAAITKEGKAVCRVWRPGQYEGLEKYDGEGKEYDTRDWISEKV